MSLYWALSGVCLMIRMNHWFRKKDHRVEESVSSHHIQGTCQQHGLLLMMATLVTWLMGCLSGFPTAVVFPPPTLPLGLQSLGEPTGEECVFSSPRRAVTARSTGAPAQEACCSLQWMHLSITYHLSCRYLGSRYLFCTLCYNPILFHFVAQIIPVWPWLLFHLTCVSLTVAVGVSLVGALGGFLTYSGSGLIFVYFLPHFQNQPFLQETLILFCGEWY